MIGQKICSTILLNKSTMVTANGKILLKKRHPGHTSEHHHNLRLNDIELSIKMRSAVIYFFLGRRNVYRQIFHWGRDIYFLLFIAKRGDERPKHLPGATDKRPTSLCL